MVAPRVPIICHSNVSHAVGSRKEGCMNKTFYQFVMAYCDVHRADACALFANRMSQDVAFPKHETDYQILCDYIELSGIYVDDLAAFDTLWAIYQNL